jgi:hypothetical protein
VKILHMIKKIKNIDSTFFRPSKISFKDHEIVNFDASKIDTGYGTTITRIKVGCKMEIMVEKEKYRSFLTICVYDLARGEMEMGKQRGNY